MKIIILPVKRFIKASAFLLVCSNFIFLHGGVVAAQEEGGDASMDSQSMQDVSLGKLQCKDFFTPRSMSFVVEPSIPTTAAGASIGFTGTLENKNNHLITNGTLYVKIVNVSDSANSSIVDYLEVKKGVVLGKDQSLPIEFSWTVPANADEGAYEIVPHFVGGDGFDYLGSFADNSTPLPRASFTVAGNGAKPLVKILPDSVTVNNIAYLSRGRAYFLPEVVGSSISTVITNPSDVEKIVPLQWNQYAGNHPTDDTVVNTSTELVTLKAGESKTISYEPKNHPESETLITVTVADGLSKTTTAVDLEKESTTDATFAIAGMSHFPIELGTSVQVFGCASTYLPVMKDNMEIRLSVLDKDETSIHEYTFTGNLNNVLTGFGDTFTPQKHYNQIFLVGKIMRNGEILDEIKISYDCALIDVSKCQEVSTNASNNTLAKYWYVIGALVMIVLGSIIGGFVWYKKRSAFSIVAIFALLFVGITTVLPTTASAKTQTWNHTSTSYLVKDFSVSSSFYDDANVQAGFNYTGYFEYLAASPAISVSYGATVLNMSQSGTPITDGSSIPVGTLLRFVPKALENSDIAINDGGYGGNVTGTWRPSLAAPAVSCSESKYFGLNIFGGVGTGDTVGGSMGMGTWGSYYLESSFVSPNRTVQHSGTASLFCDSTGENCTVTGPGTINTSFVFAGTTGRLYLRESNYNRSFGAPPSSGDICKGNNTPINLTPQQLQMDSNGMRYCYTFPSTGVVSGFNCFNRNTGSPFEIVVPTQTITYTLTATGSGAPTGPCYMVYNQECSGPTVPFNGGAHTFGSSGGIVQLLRDDWMPSFNAMPESSRPNNSCFTGYDECFNEDCRVNYFRHNTIATSPLPGSASLICSPSANSAPNPPDISGPVTGSSNTSYIFSFTANDPDGDQIYYQVDWNNDGVSDQRVPASGLINSGASESANYSWPTDGAKTFRARTVDSAGNTSTTWTSHTITLTTPAATADLKINGSDGPLTVNRNTTVIVSWSSTNASACTLYGAGLPGGGGTVAVSGSTSLSAQNSDTYVLVCGSAQDSVALTVVNTDPPTVSLELSVNNGSWTTSDRTVNSGDTLEIRWSTYNVTSCTGSGFNTGGLPSSSGGVSAATPAPNTSTDFEINCTGPGGTATDNLVVTTRALPNFTQPNITHTTGAFDPVSGTYDSVTVIFQTSNNGGSDTTVSADYRLEYDRGADGYEFTTSGALGLFTIGQSSNQNIVISGNIPLGTNRVRVTVDSTNAVVESNETDNVRTLNFTVGAPDPGLSITANPSLVQNNQNSTISWSISNPYPMSCSVFGPGMVTRNFNPATDGATGSVAVGPITAKSEYTLRCTAAGTTFTDTVSIETQGVIEEI